jgi:hypothetical protein
MIDHEDLPIRLSLRGSKSDQLIGIPPSRRSLEYLEYTSKLVFGLTQMETVKFTAEYDGKKKVALVSSNCLGEDEEWTDEDFAKATTSSLNAYYRSLEKSKSYPGLITVKIAKVPECHTF